MKITSPDFPNEGFIPEKYTCEGDNVSPTLMIEDLPEGTQSMAIVLDDPDAPKGDFIHWISYNITPTDRIVEGGKPGNNGVNDFGHHSYDGPCPPKKIHRYRFSIYALDRKLNIPEGQRLPQLKSRIKDHILASGELYGRYESTK